MMATIALPESGRRSDPGLLEQLNDQRKLSGRARSAARHRERTEAPPARQPRQDTTRTTIYVNGTADGATVIGRDYPAVPRTPELIRLGNETIRTVVRTQGRQPVPFFCECSNANCDEARWLALADFDHHAQTGEPILVDGHAC
jgi:hypothetical protein